MRHSIKRQLLLPVAILTILMAVIIYSFLIIKNEENIVNSVATYTKSTLTQYKYLREYYNHEIVSVLNEHSNAKMDIFSKKEKGTIPLPATLIQDLSSYINGKNSGTTIKFYSKYPFPNRENRVLGEFEQKAMEYFEKNKFQTFYERAMYEGKDSIRVAIADIFVNQSCVDCHNAMPSSPKRDWKLNDVAGTIEMIVSIEDNIIQNKKNTLISTLIISLFLIVLLLILFLVLNKNILIPLDRLIDYIKELKIGNLDSKIEFKQGNELNILFSNINKMRMSLKQTIENLENTSYELEMSNDELEASLDNLKSTQCKLVESEKMAALGCLVSGVAHEINTPVGISYTAISHFIHLSEIIRHKYENDEMSQDEFEKYLKEAEELAHLVYSNLERTAQLVKSFKKVSTDQSFEEKREFNINSYIKEILLSLQNIVKKTNIDIELNIDENIKANTYPGILFQIISNLVINSTIHGFEEGEKGKILISCEEHENLIKLIYKDDGKGIKEENIKKIFEPFFTTNRQDGGTGLGLNIIYNLVTSQLNGSIVCNSKINEGVEFIIEFRK